MWRRQSDRPNSGNNRLDSHESVDPNLAAWVPAGMSFLSGLTREGRNRRVLLPIQAYIDDSGGIGHADAFVLAGFIADAQAWLAFSEEWQACLATSPAISRFKMREAANRRGSF